MYDDIKEFLLSQAISGQQEQDTFFERFFLEKEEYIEGLLYNFTVFHDALDDPDIDTPFNDLAHSILKKHFEKNHETPQNDNNEDLWLDIYKEFFLKDFSPPVNVAAISHQLRALLLFYKVLGPYCMADNLPLVVLTRMDFVLTQVVEKATLLMATCLQQGTRNKGRIGRSNRTNKKKALHREQAVMELHREKMQAPSYQRKSERTKADIIHRSLLIKNGCNIPADTVRRILRKNKNS